MVSLVAKGKRKLTQDQVRQRIAADLRAIPDIRYWFMEENGQRRFQMVVSGRDGAAVNAAAAELTSQMKTLPLLALPTSTAELDRPELRVRPRADVAAELGVTTEAIAEAVRIATIGDVGPALAKFNAGDRQIPATPSGSSRIGRSSNPAATIAS